VAELVDASGSSVVQNRLRLFPRDSVLPWSPDRCPQKNNR